MTKRSVSTRSALNARKRLRRKNSHSKKVREAQPNIAAVAANGSIMEGPASVLQPPDANLLGSKWYRYSIIVDGRQKRGGITKFWGCIRAIMDAANSIAPEQPREVVFRFYQTGREANG